MKDFTPYGIIIGFIIIVGLGIGEHCYFRHVSKEMINSVVSIEEDIASGNIDSSIETIQKVIDKWRKD